MTSQIKKYTKMLLHLFVLILVCALGRICQADDSNLKLSTNDGSTQFGFQNSAGVDVVTVNSYGGVSISSNVVMPGTTFYQNGNVLLGKSTSLVGVGASNAPISKLQVYGGDLGLGDSTATGNQPITVWLTNNSGGAVTQGTIVIIGGADNSFTTTNVAATVTALGCVYDASINNATAGRVAIGGVAPCTSVGATTRGQAVSTSTTIGKAQSTAGFTVGASIGTWLVSLGSTGNGNVLLRH
jgi:hypothetical protein